MVLQNYFRDIFDSFSQDTAFSLPVYKENPLEIRFDTSDEGKTIFSSSEPQLPFAHSDVFEANISYWRRLTAVDQGCKAVYEVTLDVQDSNFTFRAGDTIGVIPQNNESEVHFILSHLDLASLADSSYTLSLNTSQKSSKIPAHIPVKSCLSHVLTHCVDLRGVLKKLFLLALSKHTKDGNERRVLEYFCSKEGSSAYQSHILNRNLCLLDLFRIFKTCKPPIQVLLAHLPRLLPRPYSIVNSGLKEAKMIKICFSVMPLENKRKGLTTGWLEKIILNQSLENGISNLTLTNDCDIVKYKVPIYLRKNLTGFMLPENNIRTPLILIGPGTGVSPFIGFLEELELYKINNPGTNHGEVWLFFGCRSPKLDFIYEKEMKEFVKKGVLKNICNAFSRGENTEAKYIQDALKQNGEEIVRLIESNASIFVCGDLKNIAAQVKDTITQCLVTSGKTQEEANKIINDMQKEKKYVVDAWS